MILHVSKTDGTFQTLNNVVQVDLSHFGNLEGKFFVKDSSQNFISVIQEINGKKGRIIVKLDNVLILTVVKDRGGNDDSRK